jgi:hypothetical protein
MGWELDLFFFSTHSKIIARSGSNYSVTIGLMNEEMNESISAILTHPRRYQMLPTIHQYKPISISEFAFLSSFLSISSLWGLPRAPKSTVCNLVVRPKPLLPRWAQVAQEGPTTSPTIEHSRDWQEPWGI